MSLFFETFYRLMSFIFLLVGISWIVASFFSDGFMEYGPKAWECMVSSMVLDMWIEHRKRGVA